MFIKALSVSILFQEWQYHDKTLKAAESEYCMENSGDGAVKLEQCNAENKSQHWYMAS